MSPTEQKTQELDYVVYDTINFGYYDEEDGTFVVTNDEEMEALSKKIGQKIFQEPFDFSNRNIIVIYKQTTSSNNPNRISQIKKIAANHFRVTFQCHMAAAFGASVMGGGLHIASIPKSRERPVISVDSES